MVLPPHQNNLGTSPRAEAWSAPPDDDYSHIREQSFETALRIGDGGPHHESPPLMPAEWPIPAGDHHLAVTGRGFVSRGLARLHQTGRLVAQTPAAGHHADRWPPRCSAVRGTKSSPPPSKCEHPGAIGGPRIGIDEIVPHRMYDPCDERPHTPEPAFPDHRMG